MNYLKIPIPALLVALIVIDAKSQTFNPTEPPLFRAPVGTTLTFTTQYTMPYYIGQVEFKSYDPGITVSPSDSHDSSTTLTVTITSEYARYWGPKYGEIDAVGFYDTAELFGKFCVCDGVFYDSSFIGYPLAHPDNDLGCSDFISTTDTLNFGEVVVNDSAVHTFAVENDSFPVYRRFTPFNIQAPFEILDTIPLSYPCVGVGDAALYKPTRVSFHPLSIGNYIDAVYIFDPIRKDSTMLILLGEGVAAGVGQDVSETNSLRINPNPCDRSAAISLSGEDIEAVTVQNILGERVLESRMEPCSSFNMNTSELSAGIYFVEVRTLQGQYRQRIFVAH